MENEKAKSIFSLIFSGNDHPFWENGFNKEPQVNEKEQEAEIAISDLRNRYSEKVREQFENSAKKLREERDNALRENWILQQKAEAAIPEQMAASGLNGGASETSLANLRAQYQGNRNDIRSGYMEELGDLAVGHDRKQAEGEENFNRQWLEYLLSLAEMEEKYKHERYLE